VPVATRLTAAGVTVGIRPERIYVSTRPLPGGVPARLIRKTIQIGGQYLLTLSVDDQGERGFKAKVAPTIGERLPVTGAVFVELPLEHVTLFDAAGDRIAANFELDRKVEPVP
jgi:hypothetical protein